MGGGVIQSERGGKRRRSRAKRKPMAEINVTPFVDVMLVLLIIFMVAAPLLTVGVPIELPQTAAKLARAAAVDAQFFAPNDHRADLFGRLDRHGHNT